MSDCFICDYIGMASVQREVHDRDEHEAGWAAVRETWTAPGRLSGIAIASAPTVVLVIANAITGLTPSLIAAGATALLAFGFRLGTRQSIRSALVGVVIVAGSAVVAGVTGQARGFFLLPAMFPFVVIAVCLVTFIARRPLTGIILNRVTGGPQDWYQRPALLRVHVVATSVCIAVNVVNACLQVVFYTAGDTVVLAAAHIATGPIFATIVAVTVVFARRNINAHTRARTEEPVLEG